jgi:hypothetical protein
MATTTNYGWTTPDNTALVKDGASAIRTLGSSIDTSVKSLSPGTTAGDVDYYTSATAKARLGIGTTGQVLTVSGGVPSWATASSGGMTLISTTTLSGASVTLSSIPQTYNSLFLVISGVTNATANGQLRCAPNASTTITQGVSTVGISSVSSQTTNNTYLFLTDFGPTYNWTRTAADNSVILSISNYASTTAWKSFNYNSGFDAATYAFAISTGAGTIKTNTAISSLVFSNSGGNLSTGTVLLYGVK